MRFCLSTARRSLSTERWRVRELVVPMGSEVLEQPLLAERARLGQAVVGLVDQAVQSSPMQEAGGAGVVEGNHVGRNQGHLDPDVLRVGQWGAQVVEVADVDGRPVGILGDHCVDEQLQSLHVGRDCGLVVGIVDPVPTDGDSRAQLQGLCVVVELLRAHWVHVCDHSVGGDVGGVQGSYGPAREQALHLLHIGLNPISGVHWGRRETCGN
jgi:hypothetical protein